MQLAIGIFETISYRSQLYCVILWASSHLEQLLIVY